jgi:DNA-binding NtrC family response regulator
MGHHRILVVDDEPTLIFFMQRSLTEGQEYLVDTAKSGEEALGKLREQGYDLIIVDLKLPDMNGLKVIEIATQLQPGALAILMTAYGSQEVEKEAQRLKVWRYVVKPFSMEEMKVIVRHALDARGKCTTRGKEMRERLSRGGRVQGREGDFPLTPLLPRFLA